MREEKSKSELHAGHRQRMYEKLEKGDLLAPHELLETMLFSFLPRVNTNEIAHRLISAFGSLPKALAADPKRLMSVKGIGAETARGLNVIHRTLELYLKEGEKETAYPNVFSGDAFPLFLLNEYKDLNQEVFDFYCLDKQKRIIFRERYASQDCTKAKIKTWQFVDLLRTHSPVGVIAVHNHPSGSCLPSGSDDSTTERLRAICALAGAVLCDHYICAREGFYSYYASHRLVHDGRVRPLEHIEAEFPLFSE